MPIRPSWLLIWPSWVLTLPSWHSPCYRIIRLQGKTCKKASLSLSVQNAPKVNQNRIYMHYEMIIFPWTCGIPIRHFLYFWNPFDIPIRHSQGTRYKMQDARCKVLKSDMQNPRYKIQQPRCKMQDARCKEIWRFVTINLTYFLIKKIWWRYIISSNLDSKPLDTQRTWFCNVV